MIYNLLTAIPKNFNYATTIGFWISIMTIFLEDNIYKKMLLSFSFAIAITGLLIQCKEKKNNFLENFIRYLLPLLITLIMKNNVKYKLNYLFFIPSISYLMYYKYNQLSFYNNFFTYYMITILLKLFYFIHL